MSDLEQYKEPEAEPYLSKCLDAILMAERRKDDANRAFQLGYSINANLIEHREEWTYACLVLGRALLEARLEYLDNIKFNKWLAQNNIGSNRLDPVTRSRLIEMAREPDRMAVTLDNSKRFNIRVIYMKEWKKDPSNRRMTKALIEQKRRIELINDIDKFLADNNYQHGADFQRYVIESNILNIKPRQETKWLEAFAETKYADAVTGDNEWPLAIKEYNALWRCLEKYLRRLKNDKQSTQVERGELTKVLNLLLRKKFVLTGED